MSKAIGVGVVALWLSGCSSEWGANETTGSEQQPGLATFDCANAPRDVNLNSTASQAQGLTSPLLYDNPVCDQGYVMEFDGTVNGVHYGYRLDTPRIGQPDGIQLRFTPYQIDAPLGQTYCTETGAHAILYEKQSNGTWLQIDQAVNHSEYAVIAGAYYCTFPHVRFSKVKKGSASSPHIYRVAATISVGDGSHYVTYQDFQGFPPGYGFGIFSIFACDANHPCSF